MTTMLLAALVGAVSWFATEFIARPIRRFFDLRGEIIRQVIKSNNVVARCQEDAQGLVTHIDLSDEEEQRLKHFENLFRDLAGQMRSFALNETLAMWFLRRIYDPLKASTALLRLSNKIGTFGAERHLGVTQVEEHLRFSL